MERRKFLAAAASPALLGLASPAWTRQALPEASLWEIGPVIQGRNYSVNMPLSPTATANGWYFDFPGPRRHDGHVHYLTRPTGSLENARGLRLRYAIDARPGTEFIPQEHPELPGTLSLYLQQRGDDWRARGRTEFARWYSPTARLVELEAGERELLVGFAENWISVLGSNRERDPHAFLQALAHAGRVGFVFGSQRARGHGIFATRPARFSLLSFSILR